MKREHQIKELAIDQMWDVIIIGGGASGLGAAVEAASRGYKTALFEAVDFAKGTSSRSTKLVHGGVRYLAQGDVKMVSEALEERGLLAVNASHLFKNQTFVIPNYSRWANWYYGFGLKVYDYLSRRLSLGKSKMISKKEIIRNLPTLKKEKLSGGVAYQDGQFDDARLAINLAQTAIENGALVVNYCKVNELLKDEKGKIYGVQVVDMETNNTYQVHSKVVINATGVFSNKILKLDGRKKSGLKVVPSQGVHIVLDASFLKSDKALMIPKTSDGRVLFAIPWHNKVVVGTTDTLIKKPSFEPKALDQEIEFILRTTSQYLTKIPKKSDVLSVFAGLRPLVAPDGNKKNTKEISRGHRILESESGLLSILGGKWTTYRKMGEELIDTAAEIHSLESKPSISRNLAIHGSIHFKNDELEEHLEVYGSDLPKLRTLSEQHVSYREKIHPRYNFTVAEVVWAVRFEMARTVEDILARRVRLLFLDAQAAIEAAPLVAKVLARETKNDAAWAQKHEKAFVEVAQNYLLK